MLAGVASYRGYFDPARVFPGGLPVGIAESYPVVDDENDHRFSYLIAQTEAAVLEHHPTAAHFRYPYVYGPHQLTPREWSIVRRIRDGRQHIIVADGGLNLTTQGYAGNLAHGVLLAADQPQRSAGQIYNCGDDQQFTILQTIEIVARHLGRDIEIVSLPDEVARPARPLNAGLSGHHRLMDTAKIRAELGYRDVVPPAEALGLTVDWLVAHAPEPGGEVEQRLVDPFDYDAEDRLLELWHDAKARMLAVPMDDLGERPHPYAHPKKPGERDHRNR